MMETVVCQTNWKFCSRNAWEVGKFGLFEVTIGLMRGVKIFFSVLVLVVLGNLMLQGVVMGMRRDNVMSLTFSFDQFRIWLCPNERRDLVRPLSPE